MEESLDSNATTCNMSNTTTSTHSSENSSFNTIEDDRGILHLMGSHVCDNGHLLDNIEVTPYETILHPDLTIYPNEPEPNGPLHYYILDDFCEEKGSVFCYLASNKKLRILGVPAVLQCLTRNISLSELAYRKRTCRIFNIAMSGLTICFTGFVSRTELNKMKKMVQTLGGRVESEYNNKIVTHLIVGMVGTNKFNSCANLGEPILTKEWLYLCYENRRDIYLDAEKVYDDNPKLVPPIFFNLNIAFYGFSDPDVLEFKELCEQNGATCVEPEDINCNYIVIQNGMMEENFPEPTNGYGLVLWSEWFWESIQLDMCANPESYSAIRKSGQNNPHSKRKRSSEGDETTPFRKRNSMESSECSLGGSTFSNISVSSLDITPVPLTKKLSANKRFLIASELLETEKNYVKQLFILLTSYKNGLESRDAKGQLLVTPERCKIMFTNIPDIYTLHKNLKDKLTERLDMWKSDTNTLIGDVICSSSESMRKTYLPFLVKFDIIKDIISTCESSNQKFKAFLKLRENMTECRRLSLRDLLIEPVQRLPRITLLLTELIKKTSPAHPDYDLLSEAQQNIKDVLVQLNEGKGRVDVKVELYEVLDDIIGFPREKVTFSDLSFIRKISIISDCDSLGAAGSYLTLFYFNEMLVIAKARLKGGSVNSATPTSLRHNKYKYLQLIRMMWISKIIDVEDKEDKFLIVWREEDNLDLQGKDIQGYQAAKKKTSNYEEQTIMCRLVLDCENKTSFLDELSMATLNVHNKIITLENEYNDKEHKHTDMFRTKAMIPATIPFINQEAILDVMSSTTMSFLKSAVLAKHHDRKDSKDEKSDMKKYLNMAKRSVSRAFTHKQSKNGLRKTQSTTLSSIFESKTDLDVRKSPRTPTMGKRSFTFKESR